MKTVKFVKNKPPYFIPNPDKPEKHCTVSSPFRGEETAPDFLPFCGHKRPMYFPPAAGGERTEK